MSALTAQISLAHEVGTIESTDGTAPGIECRCGLADLTWIEYAAHVAEVTEAATRAAVAAEIRAAHEAVRDYIAWYEENDARVWELADNARPLMTFHGEAPGIVGVAQLRAAIEGADS